MRIRLRRGARIGGGLIAALLALSVVVPAGAQAPVPPSSSDGWDNAYYQILAESLRRAGRGKRVYTAYGHAIGRIADVRTSPDGMHELAIVDVRYLIGGGVIALPFHRLSRQKDRIVSLNDQASVRAMALLDVAGDRR